MFGKVGPNRKTMYSMLYDPVATNSVRVTFWNSSVGPFLSVGSISRKRQKWSLLFWETRNKITVTRRDVSDDPFFQSHPMK